MKRNARSKTEKKTKQKKKKEKKKKKKKKKKQGMKKRATVNLCDVIQITFPRQMRFHSQYRRL